MDTAEIPSEKQQMYHDILLQISIFLLLILMFLFIQKIPQKLFSKLRFRLFSNHSNLQSKRHFVLGAQLLTKSRSSSTPNRITILNQAITEAEKAITLDPTDAAAHILKAMILQLQGYNTSAIDSLDVALSPLAVKSLSEGERSDALCKRGELRLLSGSVEIAIEDLLESVRLSGGSNGKVFELLGKCYEKLGLVDEARKAYEDAGRIKDR